MEYHNHIRIRALIICLASYSLYRIVLMMMANHHHISKRSFPKKTAVCSSSPLPLLPFSFFVLLLFSWRTKRKIKKRINKKSRTGCVCMRLKGPLDKHDGWPPSDERIGSSQLFSSLWYCIYIYYTYIESYISILYIRGEGKGKRVREKNKKQEMKHRGNKEPFRLCSLLFPREW